MAETAIQSSKPPLPVVIPAAPAQPKPKGPGYYIKKGLTVIASLRLTVILFVFALILVFCGTLAQVDAGIWTVVNQYFRSLFVWIPFKIFFPRTDAAGQPLEILGGFPFPGGWLIGALLLTNLLAAHAVRFKMNWKRSGIFLIHAGLIVMMLSEFITGMFAVEARMTIGDQERVNYVDVSNAVELAFTSRIGKTDQDEVAVIPESIVQRGGLISNEQLPVDVEVLEFMKNSTLVRVTGGDKEKYAVMAHDGNKYVVVKQGEETGVDPNQREDAHAVLVTFKRKGTNEMLGTHLLSFWYYPNFTQRQLRFEPQKVTVDGKSWVVELRPKRVYKNYTIQLKKFTHDVYVGTDTPKDFKSEVCLHDPERNETRDGVKIYMNNPLEYRGETFYQSGFLPGDRGTVLQVVDNPGWSLPYLSCIMVTLGMMVHFGMHLIGFLGRRSSVLLGGSGSGV